ncbi:unnamed protein product [Cylicocyclus nassatus]|uniref:Uncharacterized protein n=1 Tax=Cylicocyclus nassatus TaxID=53992 RepID=A0AA36H5Z7_CYLNA|nr:unnamed protein product [Cylicocyclus nassatus]
MILLLLALLLSIAGFFIYKRRVPLEPGERKEPSTKTALSRPQSEVKEEEKKTTPSEELRQQVADLAASTPQAPGPGLGDAGAPSSSSGSSATGEKPSKKKKKKSSKRKKKRSKRSRHAPPSGAPGGSEEDKKP